MEYLMPTDNILMLYIHSSFGKNLALLTFFHMI